MARGGRRVGSGRKPYPQAQDAWIAHKVNELVVDSSSRRGLEHMLRYDPDLEIDYGAIAELEKKVKNLPQAAREAMHKAEEQYFTGQSKAAAQLSKPLQEIFENLIEARNLFSKRMFTAEWARHGGTRIRPLGRRDWSKIYDAVAVLATSHFKRQFTRRAIKDAMTRETKRFREEFASMPIAENANKQRPI